MQSSTQNSILSEERKQCRAREILRNRRFFRVRFRVIFVKMGNGWGHVRTYTYRQTSGDRTTYIVPKLTALGHFGGRGKNGTGGGGRRLAEG